MFILYDLIFIIVALIYIPYLTLRQKWHTGFYLRFGFFSERLSEKLKKKKNIWIHAVSVGEVLAILDLMDEIRRRYPEHQLVLSTVTKTGFHIAQERLNKKAVVIYAPLDLSTIVRTFIDKIAPVVYICTETELWPNLFYFLHKKKVPIVLINGRISDKSFVGYQKVTFLTKKILRYVHAFCMQSQIDRDRIIALGAWKERVHVVNNLKFDSLKPLSKALTKETLGFSPTNQLLIAGSTHPGEDEIAIETYKQLIATYPNLRLVIIPRHIERAEEVCSVVRNQGLEPISYEDPHKPALDKDHVLVVGTIGVLQLLYGLADIVFVGKSFTVQGGQNMLEPVYFGKPTFVGPYTQNFRDVVEIFTKEGILFEVQTKEEMQNGMAEFLKSPDKAKNLAKQAQSVIEKYQGATKKTVDIISQYL